MFAFCAERMFAYTAACEEKKAEKEKNFTASFSFCIYYFCGPFVLGGGG